MRRPGILVIGLLVLAACGGGSTGSPAATSYTSAHDVADATGCTSYTPSAQHRLIAVAGAPYPPFRFEVGSCRLGGNPLTVMWSNRADAAFGYVFRLGRPPTDPRRYLHGDGWLVRCADDGLCRDLQGRLGGTLGKG